MKKMENEKKGEEKREKQTKGSLLMGKGRENRNEKNKEFKLV